jgi:hypothetical protein
MPFSAGPATSPLAWVLGRVVLCWLVSEPMDTQWTHIVVSQWLVVVSLVDFLNRGAYIMGCPGSGMADAIPELSPMYSGLPGKYLAHEPGSP